VDTILREQSAGARSLDDFARLFFGREDAAIEPRGYGFDDVVAGLEQVQHYDWARFLRAHLDSKDPVAPLDGLARGGWRLVFTDEPSALARAQEKVQRRLDLAHSLGIVVSTEDPAGSIIDVIWNSPAFAAGLAPGMKLVAVDGFKFSPEVLTDAVRAAAGRAEPIELLVQDDDTFRSLRVDYHGGLRYPHLARVEKAADWVDAIGRPRELPDRSANR